MVQRSIFQSGPNIHLAAMLRKVGYNRSPQLLQHLDKGARRIGGSQLVEDGVCRQRRDEEKAQSSVMSPDRAYATLVNKQILGGVHRYNEASYLHCWMLLLCLCLIAFVSLFLSCSFID